MSYTKLVGFGLYPPQIKLIWIYCFFLWYLLFLFFINLKQEQWSKY